MSIHRWKRYLVHMALSAATCVPLLVHAGDTKSGMPEPTKEQPRRETPPVL